MPGGVRRKRRPSLALVLGGSLAVTLAVPPLGLLAVWRLEEALGFGPAALLVTGGAVLATAVLGLLLWRLILGPVAALADRAQALGQGDRAALGEPLRHYGTREMGELGARVLDMARRLQSREATVRGFTDHVTHELRTPLSAIRGAAELLEEAEGLGAQDRRLAVTVLASAERLDRLLSRLRDVALLREGDFRGASLLGSESEALRAELPGLGIGIEGAEVPLPLSREGLHIVLRQLLGNAAAHGARQVRLRARARGPVLLVEDDGEGIAEGDRARVFDPFFTTRREAGGTGMGLHIVRTLVESHGGRIEALPSVGGATFRIAFGAGDGEG